MSTKPPIADLHGNLIADTSIRQPVLVTMLMLLAVVSGMLAYTILPVNQLPDIELPTVVVSVAYPGAGPESVADQVAKPIEDELTTISGVKKITSNSSEGLAVIIAEFQQETDPAEAVQNVREKVTGIRQRLPENIKEPAFQRIQPSQAPVLTLAITSKSGVDGRTLRKLIEDEIVPLVQRATGVGSTSVSGGLVRQINVDLDFGRIQSLRILPSQVTAAIAAANTNLGVGDTQSNGQNVNLRTPSVFRQPGDITNVGIPGTGYTIGDVATVADGNAEVTTYTRLNGADAVTLAIRKQTGTNTTTVAEGALQQLEHAFARYPDLQYTVVANDAIQVRKNVRGALEEIVIAVIFAILVVWLFFRDLRNTVVTIIGLPVIIIGTFAAIAAFGISINIMSLLAISVSVGLVIDDAIVVRENIFRYMERGYTPRQAASLGTAQVATSVLAMTLTLIAVFIPVTFTSGVTGIVFKSFGITVASAMALSLVEAFTLAPMLSAYWFKQKTAAQVAITNAEQTHPIVEDSPQGMLPETHVEQGRGERLYTRILNWSLRHRFATIGAGVLVVAISLVAASSLKTAFLPVPENHRMGVSFELAPGTPLAETDRRARIVEQQIQQDPAVAAVLTTVGGRKGLSGGGGEEYAYFLVKLHDEAHTDEVQARLRPLLADLPRITFSKSSYQFGDSTDVVNRPLLIKVRSTSATETLAPVVQQIEAALQGVPGLADLDTTYSPGKPELRYELIQSRANDYNLTNRDLASTMRIFVDGSTAAVYRENGEDYDVVVRLRPEDRATIESISSLRLPLGQELLPLSTVANVTLDRSPTTIRRAERLTEVVVGANNLNRNVNDVQKDVQARIAGLSLPQGVTVTVGGASDDQAEGFTSLLLAMLLSVLFVYMVLASQFGSFSQPLVLMLAMPLSFIGAFLAIRMANLELDIIAMIGLLMLLGLVVKNSILLVDFTNKLRAEGMEKHAALEMAGAARLRPILMTSLTVIAGNIPAALGLGDGAELRRGLGTAVIGGMITSTLLTLVLVPSAYSLLDGLLARLGRLRQSRQPVVASRQPTPTTALTDTPTILTPDS